MYLQGNLQAVFDALYELGVIEPVLEMDWQNAMTEMNTNPSHLFEVLSIANQYQNDVKKLCDKLEDYDEKTLGFLAMEVAREFADFHSRDEVH